MARVLRIALMWLTALAVPLQGFAATSMLFCAPVHEAAVHDQHAAHDHAMHGHSHHHAQPADDTHVDDMNAQALDEAATTKCSVCASCCSGAALAPQTISYTPPRGHAVFHAVDPSATFTFLTGGLDRPPRFPLA